MQIQEGHWFVCINDNGNIVHYDLTHLKDKSFVIDEFETESKHVIKLNVNIVPTNHLYSRAFIPGKDSVQLLEKTGELLRRYDHYSDNYRAITQEHTISNELRVFCIDKYLDNLSYFSDFIEYLKINLNKICVLPHLNKGDDRKSLTGLLSVKEGKNYIVLFKLHKTNKNSINMFCETAFVVTDDDFRAKKLIGSDGKPFLVLIRNVLSGRKPFEGKAKSAAKKGYKKKKKAKNKV
ncbi:hypothetical protein [Photobacterium leiognathi]|uniref:hypothetical protein n=1 Tax=Photobacterium leiognathi TaxID=553611 RepID=UPI002980E481|nr:hypothetical protein [Photobacterium leiognathi]